MSIIEQTLDKLERTSSTLSEKETYIPYEFHLNRPIQKGKSLKIFMILFSILLIAAYFVLSQGVKLNISVAQEKMQENNSNFSKDILTLQKNKTQQIIETPIIEKPQEIKKTIVHSQNTSIKQEIKQNESNFETDLKPYNSTSKKAPLKKQMQKTDTQAKVFEPEIKENNSFIELSNQIPKQLELGNYSNVLTILDKHKIKLINTWEYYYWQSQAYIGLKQLTQANDSVDIGIQKNNTKGLLLIQKGLILQEKDDHEAAIEVFKKAETMKLKPASLYLNMGYSAAMINDLTLAKRSYNRYLAMTKNVPEHDTMIRQQVIDYMRQIN